MSATNSTSLSSLVLFFQPVSTKSRRNLRRQIQHLMLGITSALALVILSGVSLAAAATFIIAACLMLLILDRVLGIEIMIPNWMPWR